MWGLPQKQNARRAYKIRICGHLRRYKKIVKKTYMIYDIIFPIVSEHKKWTEPIKTDNDKKPPYLK